MRYCNLRLIIRDGLLGIYKVILLNHTKSYSKDVVFKTNYIFEMEKEENIICNKVVVTPVDPLLRLSIMKAKSFKSQAPNKKEESLKTKTNIETGSSITNLLCPNCDSKMILRKASMDKKNGDNVGKLYWVCEKYPKCKKVIEYTPTNN